MAEIYTLAVRHHSDAPDELGAVTVYPTFEDAAAEVREVAREEHEHQLLDDDSAESPAELDLGEVFEYLHRKGIYAEILQHELAR